MNRFILIGNGFDLAHGLKTSYSDFICWYLKKHLLSSLAERSKEIGDELITFNAHCNLKLSDEDEGFLEKSSLQDLRELKFISWGFQDVQYEISFLGGGVFNRSSYQKPDIQVSFKSKFLKDVLRDQNWTDIERFYYETLVTFFKKFVDKSKATYSESIRNPKLLEAINAHNREFNLLKSELIKYLTEINSSIERINELSPLENLMDRLFQEPDEDYLSRYIKLTAPKENAFKLVNTTFINFNYTSLLEKYLANRTVNHIQIHGAYKNSDKVIFGYGDDTHKDYQNLEDAEINELMEHMKPFYYPNSKKYINLINSLDEDDYEVCVVGHSLGLSDRVLLKTIFEHKNCMAIRLFHRGDESRQVVQRINLSRHFTDKQAMRRKMVEFDARDVIPQNKVKSHLPQSLPV